MPGLIALCHALFLFGWYPWEVCSFLRGNGGEIHLGDRGVSDGKTGEIEGSRGCGLDVLYEIIINKNRKWKKIKICTKYRIVF